jgi:hypothetical protein
MEKRITPLDPTCSVQVISMCGTLCVKLCSLDSLPRPGGILQQLPKCILP